MIFRFMNFIKLISIILIIFSKTGNVLSKDNIFNVNNIEVVKKDNLSNDALANIAIKRGYTDLIEKILLEEDKKKLTQLNLTEIKELVSYYQMISKKNDENSDNKLNFNIFFDRDKLHNLFFKKNILYSEIIDKEIYLLPIFKKNDQIYIYSQNFFYEKWNKIYLEDLIEFILPIENIEVIQNININKNNLLNLNLKDLFAEYKNKNLALILIEDTNSKNEKIYLRVNIMQKKIDKSIIVERSNLENKKYYEKIILKVSKEIINLVKSQNLIDIRTPSFINTIISIDKKNDLVRLNKRLKKIDLINDLYVQEFNNEYVLLKIKYLGKLDKIINQLQNQQINLSLINDQWRLEIQK